MFPIFDHIDCLIAADCYEENGQTLLSEAMRQLNRPNLEYWWCGDKWRFRSFRNRQIICARQRKSRSNTWTSLSKSSKSTTSFSRSKTATHYCLGLSIARTKSTYRYMSITNSRSSYVPNI